MWRDDAYLLDMLLAARKVCKFTQNATWEQFQTDELMQNGVMRQIQSLGRLPVRFRLNINRNIRRFPGRKSLVCGIG